MAYGDGVWLVVVSVAGELVSLVRAVVRPRPAAVHYQQLVVVLVAVRGRVERSVEKRMVGGGIMPVNLINLSTTKEFRTHTPVVCFLQIT